MSHCGQYKTVPALVVYVFRHTGSRIYLLAVLEYVHGLKTMYVTRTYHLSNVFFFLCWRTWFRLYCKCDIFIFLYISKMYWIHYKDEGISVSSLLKTPCNGSEFNWSCVALVGGKCGQRVMQVKQQEGASRCWVLGCQQQKLITHNLAAANRKQKEAGVIKTRTNCIILLLRSLCLYEIGSMQ